MGWYNSAWLKRKKITIDQTKVDADLTDFPVYVNLANLGSDFFDDAKSDGSDIVVTSSDGTTKLKRELVAYDAGSDTGELHFKAPSISGSVDTDFYIYYKNAAGAETNDTDTWRSEFTGVYHLNDLTTSTIKDSSQTGSNGTKTSAGNPAETDGKIGKGQTISSDRITFSDIAGHQFGTGEFAIFVYLKTSDNTSATPSAIGRLQNAGSFNGWQIGQNYDSTNHYLTGRIRIGGNSYDATHSVAVNNGAYHRVVLRRTTANGADLWKNGAQVATNTNATVKTGDVETGAGTTIGAERSSGTNYWIGDVDEIRLWKGTAPSDAWLVADYNNFNSPNTFYSVGAAETDPGSGGLIFFS